MAAGKDQNNMGTASMPDISGLLFVSQRVPSALRVELFGPTALYPHVCSARLVTVSSAAWRAWSGSATSLRIIARWSGLGLTRPFSMSW
jgi:hypothetical protein